MRLLPPHLQRPEGEDEDEEEHHLQAGLHQDGFHPAVPQDGFCRSPDPGEMQREIHQPVAHGVRAAAAISGASSASASGASETSGRQLHSGIPARFAASSSSAPPMSAPSQPVSSPAQHKRLPSAGKAPSSAGSKIRGMGSRLAASAGGGSSCFASAGGGSSAAPPPRRYSAEEVSTPQMCPQPPDPVPWPTKQERKFEDTLRERGFEIRKQAGDGNCLFRAVSEQVYGDPEMHGQARKLCMEFMAKERDHFSQFMTEDFNEYIERKRKDGCFGNNLEIQSICEIFNRPVHVYSYGADPINIFHGNYDSKDNPPIRLSYHGGNHYNAVVDPYEATVGVGLGLPGLIPGLADKQQMDKAIEMSEDDVYAKSTEALQLESDREATEYELEQAIIAASLAEFQAQTALGGAAAAGVPAPYAAAPRARVRDHGMGMGMGMGMGCAPPSKRRKTAAGFDHDGGHEQQHAEREQAMGVGLSLAEPFPASVQELLHNGFSLEQVAKAYGLFGDSFDLMLQFLMAQPPSQQQDQQRRS